MSRATFTVWSPDDGDRPEVPNVVALDGERAAIAWVTRKWSELDYPDEILVRVDDLEGHRFEFIVAAEPSTTFRAYTPD